MFAAKMERKAIPIFFVLNKAARKIRKLKATIPDKRSMPYIGNANSAIPVIT
jgi:hypothetical protein